MSVSENSHFKFENVRLQHLRPDHVQLTLLNWDNESVLLIWLQLGYVKLGWVLKIDFCLVKNFSYQNPIL